MGCPLRSARWSNNPCCRYVAASRAPMFLCWMMFLAEKILRLLPRNATPLTNARHHVCLTAATLTRGGVRHNAASSWLLAALACGLVSSPCQLTRPKRVQCRAAPPLVCLGKLCPFPTKAVESLSELTHSTSGGIPKPKSWDSLTLSSPDLFSV